MSPPEGRRRHQRDTARPLFYGLWSEVREGENQSPTCKPNQIKSWGKEKPPQVLKEAAGDAWSSVESVEAVFGGLEPVRVGGGR